MKHVEYRKALRLAGALLLGIACAGCPPMLGMAWYRFLGADADDAAFAVEKTQNGGYIIAGFSEASAEESDDAYLLKVNAAGLVEWEAHFGDDRDDAAYAVAPTADGGYILAGQFGDENAEVSDAFLLKTDANGTEEWRQVMDSGGSDSAISVQQTADGGYLLGIEMDILNTSDATMLKTDAAGVEQWRITGPEGSHAVEAIQTKDGGCIFAWWQLVLNAKAGLFAGKIGLVKTDAAGAVLWENDLTDDEAIQLEDVCETTDGGLMLVGQLDFLGSDTQLFLWKTDAAGDTQWRSSFGDTGRNIARAVRQLPNGDFVLAGEALPPGRQAEALLVYADKEGLLRWLRYFGGGDRDCAYGVVPAFGGGFLLAGTSESAEADGEPDHAEIFVIKTDPHGHAPGIEIEE